MHLTIKKALGTGALLGTFVMFLGLATPAQAACDTPGTVAFPNLAASRGAIIPSVHKQLSSYGRMAKYGGCDVVITCVMDESLGSNGKKTRDGQCKAASQAMARFERRTRVRDALTKSYEQVKVDASGAWKGGTVYITLQ